jgi:hypothetical protein
MGILDAIFGRSKAKGAADAIPGWGHGAPTKPTPAAPRKGPPPPKAMVQIDERSTYVYYVPVGTKVGDVLEVPWGRPKEEWLRGTVVAMGSKPWPKYPGGPMRPAYTGRCRYARPVGREGAS